MQLYNTYVASFEDLASNGMVSLSKVIIPNAGMMHFIGFLNCNNNNHLLRAQPNPYSAIKIQFLTVILIR